MRQVPLVPIGFVRRGLPAGDFLPHLDIPGPSLPRLVALRDLQRRAAWAEFRVCEGL